MAAVPVETPPTASVHSIVNEGYSTSAQRACLLAARDTLTQGMQKAE